MGAARTLGTKWAAALASCLLCIDGYGAEPGLPRGVDGIVMGAALDAGLKARPAAREYKDQVDPRFFHDEVVDPRSGYADVGIAAHQGRVCRLQMAARPIDQNDAAGFEPLIAELTGLWGPPYRRHRFTEPDLPREPHGDRYAAISWRIAGGARAVFVFLPPPAFEQGFGLIPAARRYGGLVILVPGCLSAKAERETLQELEEIVPGVVAGLSSGWPESSP